MGSEMCIRDRRKVAKKRRRHKIQQKIMAARRVHFAPKPSKDTPTDNLGPTKKVSWGPSRSTSSPARKSSGPRLGRLLKKRSAECASSTRFRSVSSSRSNSRPRPRKSGSDCELKEVPSSSTTGPVFVPISTSSRCGNNARGPRPNGDGLRKGWDWIEHGTSRCRDPLDHEIPYPLLDTHDPRFPGRKYQWLRHGTVSYTHLTLPTIYSV